MRQVFVLFVTIGFGCAFALSIASRAGAADSRAPIWIQNCAPYPARVTMFVQGQGADWQQVYASQVPLPASSAMRIRLPDFDAARSSALGRGSMGSAEASGVRLRLEFLEPVEATAKPRTIGQATATTLGNLNGSDHYLLGFGFLATPQHQPGKYNDVQFSGKPVFGAAPKADDPKALDPPPCAPAALPT